MLNKIFNEDCLDGMKRIPDGSIDAIICDLPYWVTACKWDSVIPFEPMWKELKRIIKPNGAIVLFGSEPFSSALRMSNIKQYKYDWIWDKEQWTNQFLAKYQPMKKHEIISVFCKNKTIYNPQFEQVKRKTATRDKNWWKDEITWVELKETFYDNKWLKYPTTVLKFNRELQWRFHPTQKPVALIEYLIKTYTQEWETVLDFTMGSGTLAIAAINTNRNYIGFEMDKGYFDIAQERITKHLCI